MDRREFVLCAAGIVAASAAYIARFGERNMREFERRMEALNNESEEGNHEGNRSEEQPSNAA